MPLPDPRFVAVMMLGGALIGALGAGATIMGRALAADQLEAMGIPHYVESEEVSGVVM